MLVCVLIEIINYTPYYEQLKIIYILIEVIYFFEVNTKHISSSVLKTSELSRVRRTREHSDVFNSRDEIYLVVTDFFLFYTLIDYMHCKVSPAEKGGAENAKD